MVPRVGVRLVASAQEEKRWDELIRRHHYLGVATMVGETLRYVAELDGRWAALTGFASAALKVKARDEHIGWTPEQQTKRVIYIAQNARFLILPGFNVANMGSRVLGLCLRRLSNHWQTTHSRPVLVCETFVNPSLLTVASYRRMSRSMLKFKARPAGPKGPKGSRSVGRAGSGSAPYEVGWVE